MVKPIDTHAFKWKYKDLELIMYHLLFHLASYPIRPLQIETSILYIIKNNSMKVWTIVIVHITAAKGDSLK